LPPDASSRESATKRQRVRRWLARRSGKFWGGVIAGVCTLVVAPLAVYAGQKFIDRATEVEPTPHLEVTDVAVKNDGQGSPRIDLKVTNTGGRVAFITRVAFSVRSVENTHGPARRDCYQGAGFFPPTSRYDIALPAEGGRGETVIADVSQEVKADSVDRFVFRVAVPEKGRRPHRAGTIANPVSRLFELEALVFHDGESEPTKAGIVLLAAPFPRAEYFDLYSEWGEVGPCERDNQELLNRLLERPGARDDALVAFARAASAGTLLGSIEDVQ
jgi:hypothetical protein